MYPNPSRSGVHPRAFFRPGAVRAGESTQQYGFGSSANYFLTVDGPGTEIVTRTLSHASGGNEQWCRIGIISVTFVLRENFIGGFLQTTSRAAFYVMWRFLISRVVFELRLFKDNSFSNRKIT